MDTVVDPCFPALNVPSSAHAVLCTEHPQSCPCSGEILFENPTPRLSLRRVEELTYLDADRTMVTTGLLNEGLQVRPEREQLGLNYGNFCIRDTVLGSSKALQEPIRPTRDSATPSLSNHNERMETIHLDHDADDDVGSIIHQPDSDNEIKEIFSNEFPSGTTTLPFREIETSMHNACEESEKSKQESAQVPGTSKQEGMAEDPPPGVGRSSENPVEIIKRSIQQNRPQTSCCAVPRAMDKLGSKPKPAFTVDAQVRNGVWYTDGNGYYYRMCLIRETSAGEKNIHVKCPARGCKGCAIVRGKTDKKYLQHTKPHTCKPNPNLGLINALRNRIIDRCSTDLTTPFLQIFCEETKSPGVPEAVRKGLSYKKIRPNMTKTRYRSRALRDKEQGLPDPDDATKPNSSHETPVESKGPEKQLLYKSNGYFYQIKKSRYGSKPTDENICTLACEDNKCSGTMLMEIDGDSITLTDKDPHTCDAIISALRGKILERCAVDSINSLQFIFFDVLTSSDVPQEIRQSLRFRNIMKSMLAIRQGRLITQGTVPLSFEFIKVPSNEDSRGCKEEPDTVIDPLMETNASSALPSEIPTSARNQKRALSSTTGCATPSIIEPLMCYTDKKDENVTSCCSDEHGRHEHHSAWSKAEPEEPMLSEETLGTGSSGFEITVIQAGNGKLYSDGNGYFYRMEHHFLTEGDVTVSYVRCTYENCDGRAVMRRRGNNITLFHKNSHSCEPNTYFQNVTALRQKILHRCEAERRKAFKTIFNEETSSYDLSAAVRASLSLSTLLASMEKARVKRKRKRETETRKPSPVQPTDEESTCEQLSKLPATEGPTGTVTQFVYINEDGILKEEEYVEEEKLIELLENDHADEEISKSCIVTNPSPSESINTAEASNTKNHSSSLDLGSGLPALKIPGRAGSISIYTDGVDYFYRKNRHVLLKSGLDTWYMSCTYDDCQGKGIMQLKDDKLTLYHRYPHSCEPIPCLADLMDMKKRIMERCKSDRITPLRQIFDEETMSPDYAPEIGALLSYSSMESAMQKARGKLFHPKW